MNIISCIAMTPEVKELHKQFPKMNESIFRNFVRLWQGYNNKENVLPTKEELTNFIPKVFSNWSMYLNPEEVQVADVAYRGANSILSNFSKRPFFIDAGNGIETYNSVEQAFQMAKFNHVFNKQGLDPEIFDKVEDVLDKMSKTTNPYTLQKLGDTRGILPKEDLEWWDANKKDIMERLMRESFRQNPKALQALLATGNKSLTHSKGSKGWEVWFPAILEKLREEFRGAQIGDNFNLISNAEIIPVLEDNSVKVYDRSNIAEGVEITKNGNTYNISVPSEFDLDKDRATAFTQALYDLIPSGAEVTSSDDPKSKTILNLVKKQGLEEKDGELVKSAINTSSQSGYIINEHESRWTRDEVENDPHTLYIFTDNTDRTSGGEEIGDGWYAEKYGKGGYGTEHNPTSAVIRGLPNAAPISTMKWFYRAHGVSVDEARWTDVDINEFIKVIDEEIEDIKRLWDTGNFNSIELPMNGIFGKEGRGRGISQLNKYRTPRLYAYLNKKMQELSEYVKDTKRSQEYKEDSNVIDVDNWHKFDSEVSSTMKRSRINLINDLFNQEVNRELDATKDRLNGELKRATTRAKKLRLAKAIKNLRPYLVIKQKGPFELFERVRQLFIAQINFSEARKQILIEEELVKLKPGIPDGLKRRLAENRVNNTVKAYQQILDNWNDLVIEAANTYGYDYGVIIDVTANSIEEDIDETPTDEEGNNRNEEDDDAKDETPYKEGWQVKVRELSAFESQTNQVRRAISNIYRTDRNGDYVLDDLGYKMKLQASYVFADLINVLKDMTSASQMMPILESLRGRKLWAGQIIEALKNDDSLFTAFYKVFRKDYLNMWVQIEKVNPDGSVSYKTVNINKPIGTSHYFDEWRDNFEYGIVFDEDSIYNHNGEIDLANSRKGLAIVDDLLSDKLRNVKTKEEKQQVILENVESIHKLLSMIGVSITENTLKDVLTYNVNPEDKAELPGMIVLNNLRVILKDMPVNEGIKDGEPADLINTYGRAFNAIAMAINNVEEDEVEASTRQGKKTLYAHTRPSYLTTLIKKLKGSEAEEYIEREYKPVDFLYDKQQGRWLNHLIEDLETDEDARDKLGHAVVIEFNRKEYEKWTPLETFLVLFNQYNAEPMKGGEGYAWYQVPLLSDATSAEFIRAKRVKKDFKNVISDKFTDLVRQEYNRIITVKKRYNSKERIEKIASYDMSDDKAGGAKFHFFPELNNYTVVDIDGVAHIRESLSAEEAANAVNRRSFFDYLAEVAEDTDEFNRIAKEAVTTAMNNNFAKAIDTWASIGVFDRTDENNEASSFKYFKNKTRKNVESVLEEYYWNTSYMQSQIIQLLTTDLAYYKNYADFTKRALEFHSPTEKLNTLAKWNGEYVLADSNGNVRPERVIYLKDEIKASDVTAEVEKVIDEKIARGELTLADKTVILDKWRKTNTTDAQAYRTLKSYRATMIAADMWDDDMENAYNNIRRGTWTAMDFTVLWNTRKPYLYTQTNQPDRVGGTMRLAAQHKNSEMIMLTQAIFGSILHNSTKFRALSEYMEDENNNIDVAMFGTAVKVGGQGFIDLNGAESVSDVKRILDSRVKNPDGSINNEVVHEFNWEDYGIQVATPEHGINAIQLVGTQIRRLIGTDMSADAKFKIGDKELTREQWRNFFNAVNTANIREAFEKLDKEFSDMNKISELLINEIKSSKRYTNDLIEAVSLDESGQFNIPIFDPAQSQKIQELLNSIIKTRIVKQKIAGGSLIQASDWALNEKDKPKIVFETDKNGKVDKTRIKYIEAYIACPDDRLYELLLEDDGSININKKDSKGNYIVPEKYRQAIGYRVPTEDKYSMIPIRIKGFLPRQVGSVIILPDEITTTTGSDFDVDKIYMMYHTLDYKPMYDIKRAWDDFYKANPDIVSEIDSNFGTALEQFITEQTEGWDEEVDEADRVDFEEEFKSWLKKEGVKRYSFSTVAQNRFTEWFDTEKERYLIRKSISIVDYKEDKNVDYNDKMAHYNSAKKKRKAERDSMIIDLMWSVLTNSDTAGKMVNPGNFDEQKRNARIINILNNLSLDQIENLGGINYILNLTLDEAEDMLEKFEDTVNPLTPDTWITYQQRNMSGASLVPMAATQNASHALTQLTNNFGLKKSYRFIFNGKRLGSLHSVRSVDGKYISRNVSSYLAAFVDNAKDPVAGDLNINEITANLTFLLLRLGNSPLTTGLVLRQPATMTVMKYVNSGRYTVSQAIEEAFNLYKKSKVNVASGGKVIDFNFTDEWLAANIAAEKNANFNASHIEEYAFANNQLKVLYMLKQMFRAADALGDVVRAIRSDSQSGGAGGSIAAGNEKMSRVVKILNAPLKDRNYPLEGLDFINELYSAFTEEDIMNSTTPIQTATFQYGLVMTKKWFNNLFPQVSGIFQDVVDVFKLNSTYGNLDDTTVNRIYSNFIVYLMTGFSKDFQGTEEERDYYINQFPVDFADIKAANPAIVEKNPLLKRLKVLHGTKYNGSPVIVFNNVGKVTELQADGFRSDFRNLLQNEGTNELARKLLIYSFYRGLGFSPSGYSNLIPSMLKMSDITDYVPALRSIAQYVSNHSYFESTVGDADSETKGAMTNFFIQYVRNNLDDRRFVPEVSGTGLFKETPPDTFNVTVEKNSSKEMKKFIFMEERVNDDIVYRPFVCYTYKGGKFYYMIDSSKPSGSYKLVKPLGSRQYQEYNFNEVGDVMESKIAEAQPKGFNTYEDRAAQQIEAAIAGREDELEAMYSSMPDFDDIPLPDPLPQGSGSQNFDGIRFGVDGSVRNRPVNEPSISDAQYRQMQYMEDMYNRMMGLEAQDTDMEGNNKCK